MGTHEEFSAINCKRSDLVVTDAYGLTVVLEEHQVRGQCQGFSLGKNPIKKTTDSKTGIGFLEVFEGHQYNETEEEMYLLLGLKKPQLLLH